MDAPAGAPRFVALYPMYDGQFAVNEGQAVYARDGHDQQTSRWLFDAISHEGGISGQRALVVDLQTRRAWRGPIDQAIGFVIKMRRADGQSA